MVKVNLGCGTRVLSEWINIDFVKRSNNIIAHNLLMGIPLKNEEADIIYNSHMLEHFPRTNAHNFVKECFRVLKPGGVFRIIVPDLEKILSEYFINLKKARKGDTKAILNYEWNLIELFDQFARESPGGQMGKLWSQERIKNEDYIVSRMGSEFKAYQEKVNNKNQDPFTKVIKQGTYRGWQKYFKFHLYKRKLLSILLKDDNYDEHLKIGKYRKSGEPHFWMYDEFSLTRLLKDCGFKNIQKVDAFTSNIPDWKKNSFLDVDSGVTRKPDSLFIEASK